MDNANELRLPSNTQKACMELLSCCCGCTTCLYSFKTYQILFINYICGFVILRTGQHGHACQLVCGYGRKYPTTQLIFLDENTGKLMLIIDCDSPRRYELHTYSPMSFIPELPVLLVDNLAMIFPKPSLQLTP